MNKDMFCIIVVVLDEAYKFVLQLLIVMNIRYILVQLMKGSTIF